MSARGPFWFEMLLRLHPADFRVRYADPMRETLAMRRAELGGRVSRLRFAVREGIGMLATALRERLRALTRAARGSVGGGAGAGRELATAARRLARAPGFTFAAVGVLGLGMGASMSVYTLLHGVVLRPLPYERPDRLVWLDHRVPSYGVDGPVGTTAWLYVRYSESSRLLEDVALGTNRPVTLISDAGPAERLSRAVVSPSAASVLGVEPLLGRWLDRADPPSAVVLAEGLWRRRFGADPGVLGRAIRLGESDYEVIGVMPAALAFPDAMTQLWTGAEFTYAYPDRGFNYVAVGRMVPGATVDDVRAEMTSLMATLSAADGATGAMLEMAGDGNILASPVTLHEHVVGSVGATLWMLLGAVALLLVTAWANVTNLFLVRSDVRRPEVSVRRALGASRVSIARFFLAEGVWLGLLSGALGLAIAAFATRMVLGFVPLGLPRADAVAVDGNVLVTGLMLSLVTGIVLTILPALRAPDAAGVVRMGARGGTADPSRLRLRGVLMGGQVALALVLLAGAGLLLRSYHNVRAMTPGFAADDALFVDIALSPSRFSSRAATAAFFDDVVARIESTPGVAAAGLATCVPFDGYCWGEGVVREDAPAPGPDAAQVVSMRRVSAGFFEALRLPMVAGRPFTAADQNALSDVAVVSAETARRLFPDEDPIGRRVSPGGGNENPQWFTIVGVAVDVATKSVLERSPEAVFYLPIRDSRDDPRTVSLSAVTLVIRGSGEASALIPIVRSILREADPEIAPSRIRTLDQLLASDRSAVAFATLLLVLAGAIALILSAVGIYAVFSCVIGRRTAEFGLRLALGARASDVFGIVFRQAAVVTMIGAVVGLAVAAGGARLLTHLLFGVQTFDAPVYALALALLVAVAATAAALPALRACRLQPTEALRE